MHIISVVNQKGGVGKTNLITNLSSYLASLNQKVLIIDFDPQGNATSGLGIDKNQKGIYEILSQKVGITDAVISVKENLSLIPANQNLAGANIELVNQIGRELILKKQIAKLGNSFDYVFIDNPPSLGLLTVNSLSASDWLLIPVQSEYYALEGLSSLLEIVELVQKTFQPNLSILGAVLTMYDKRSRLSSEVWEELYKYFPGRIFRTIIPRNISLAEAPSFGKSILEYDPSSTGGKAYQRLAKEFLYHFYAR